VLGWLLARPFSIACTWSNISRSMIGGWTILADRIQVPDSFLQSLV
jgi:hypothetical protein